MKCRPRAGDYVPGFFCYHDTMLNDPIIKPTTDLFIASLWSAPKNEPILRSLLSGVMTDIGQPPIVKATVLNPFNIQDFPVNKQIKLDVRVEDETKAIYNIEVQTAPHPGFFNRILYYWAKVYSGQLKRGEGYEKLHPVRSIVITEFPVFPNLKELHTVFDCRSRENPAVMLSDHMQIHVLRLGDFERNTSLSLEQLSLDLQRWIQFWAFGLNEREDKMSAMLEDSPPVLEAYKEFQRFSSDKAAQDWLRWRERFLDEQQLDLTDAWEKGLSEGEAKGRKAGLSEGELKGEVKKAQETARMMKQEGFEATMIARITGLPLSEIERLE